MNLSCVVLEYNIAVEDVALVVTGCIVEQLEGRLLHTQVVCLQFILTLLLWVS